MSNSMKLIIRTLLIAVILVVGSWLASILRSTAITTGLSYLPSVVVCLSYILAGVTLGTMVSPKFNRKNRWIYLFPIAVFLIIAMTPILYYLAPFLHIPSFAVNVLADCTRLAWALVGFFLALAFE